MKIKTILFSLLVLTSACQPDSVCEQDLFTHSGLAYLHKKAKKPYTGKIVCQQGNDQPALEGFYQDGKRHGKFTTWRTDSIPALSENFKSGELHGERLTWHPNGELALQEFYVQGVPDQSKSTWYDSGKKSTVDYIKMDKPHGKSLAWYPNEQTKHEKNFSEGVLDGEQTTWYENGTKASRKFYLNGNEDGKQLAWFENGQLKHEKIFSKGLLDGAQVTWYKDGTKAVQAFYIAGKEDGKQLAWYENGKKKYVRHIKNGKKTGTWREWEKSGKATLQVRYYNDRTIEEAQKEFTELILRLQKKYVGVSCGKWAYQCFTWDDSAYFKATQIPAKIKNDLTKDASFIDLIVSLKQMPAHIWPSLRQKGLRTFKPTWSQLGKISCEGQTDAGQIAEKAVAGAVVRAADKLIKKSEKELFASL